MTDNDFLWMFRYPATRSGPMWNGIVRNGCGYVALSSDPNAYELDEDTGWYEMIGVMTIPEAREALLDAKWDSEKGRVDDVIATL